MDTSSNANESTNENGLIIELDGAESCTTCMADGSELVVDSQLWNDLMDCAAGGDVSGDCEYMLDNYDVQFRIVKQVEGEYQNLLASAEDKKAVCENIYFESETDFSDERDAEMYLVWSVACDESER